MRKILFLLAVLTVGCLSSCVRIEEIPSEPKPSDTTIVDGWQEVNNKVDIN